MNYSTADYEHEEVDARVREMREKVENFARILLIGNNSFG